MSTKQQIILTPAIDTNETTAVLENKQINELINEFKNVNPAYKKFFAIPAQRKALKNLLETFSYAQLQNAIKILPETNFKEYAPVISSPFELELKIAKLMIFVQREKLKAQKPKGQVIINIHKQT